MRAEPRQDLGSAPTPEGSTPLYPEHKCFGCDKQIADNEPHIHVGLDEWSASQGLSGPFGLDDIFTFAYCSDCTEPGGPWIPERHEIEAAVGDES